MKRAVICVPDPWNYLPRYDKDYSVMVINPDANTERIQYLLDNSDYSILVTQENEYYRDGGDYEDERFFWYTSGTTGDSKFYSFSWDKVERQIDNIIDCYNLTANDRYVSVMPLWHAHGQMFYYVARKLGIETNFLPMNRVHGIVDYNPTFITAVPDILKLLVKQKFKDLRFVRTASSPLNESTYHTLQHAFGVPIIEAFGMTESCSHCFTNPLYGEQRAGTIGLPAGIEAKIENGHLYIQGPSVFKEGWFDTQDLAEQDSAGYYKIVGRAVDTINIRGIKYNPASLEQQIISRVTNIGECVIFGKNKIKCLYVGDVDPNEIRDFLIGINPHCRPRILEQVEKIPLNATGKISRTYLDTQYQ